MHGRRQFVPQGVLLSQITNETPIVYLLHGSQDSSHYSETAGVKSEEGGGNDRSVCSECSGLHARYKGQDNGSATSKEGAIPKPGRSSDRGL